MKKLIGLLSILFMLTLLVPPKQAEAFRGPGGSPGSGGHGEYSRPGGPSGSGGPGGHPSLGGHGGYSGHGRPEGHGFFRERGRYYGPGGYVWYGDFFPGLIIGSILGWALWPDYYYPPYYYYPAPPEGNQAPPPAGQGSDSRMFIYPRQGQSEEQQNLDFDECHSWAVGQTGFDPKKHPEGPPDTKRVQNSRDYLRAISACLDARGYTLR